MEKVEEFFKGVQLPKPDKTIDDIIKDFRKAKQEVRERILVEKAELWRAAEEENFYIAPTYNGTMEEFLHTYDMKIAALERIRDLNENLKLDRTGLSLLGYEMNKCKSIDDLYYYFLEGCVSSLFLNYPDFESLYTLIKDFFSEDLEILTKFKEKLKEFVDSFDFNGHFAFSSGFYRDPRETFINERFTLGLYSALNMDRGYWIQKKLIQEYLSNTEKYNGESIQLNMLFNAKCPHCGKSLNIIFDGKKLAFVGDPCTKPNGSEAFSVDVDFPTGELFFTDDARPWFPDPEISHSFTAASDRGLPAGHFDIMNASGEENYVKSYASRNILHGYTGNSCPHVFQSEDNPDVFLIGNFYSEDYEKYTPEGFKKVGSIITDLWWATVVDMSTIGENAYRREYPTKFKYHNRRLIQKDKTKREFLKQGFSVKAKPGKWTCRFFPRVHSDEEEVFMILSWKEDL
jgi:hypothetical protein